MSVLPLPVGAVMTRCSPAAILGQLCAWTSVGVLNREANQASIPGWNALAIPDMDALLARICHQGPR